MRKGSQEEGQPVVRSDRNREGRFTKPCNIVWNRTTEAPIELLGTGVILFEKQLLHQMFVFMSSYVSVEVPVATAILLNGDSRCSGPCFEDAASTNWDTHYFNGLPRS